MFCDFTTTTHGKWILAGEHAVLRAKGALVFPLNDKRLTLSYTPSIGELSADYSGESGAEMQLLLWSVLERGQQLLGDSLNHLTGHFNLHSDIPIGVGLGASAALCVAAARWFSAQHLLTTQSVFSFAKALEHLFHGQSSGLDIAGVSAASGLYFQNGQIESIQQQWQPHWYLSSCEQMGITSHCIHQVRQLWQDDPQKGVTIDETMEAAVQKARQALAYDKPESLALLAQAINESAHCFKQWGLISKNLSHHMNLLYEQGALAVKPTGSGGGGFVVSLWEKPPEKDSAFVQGAFLSLDNVAM